jgi:hypothetical protein
MGECSCTFLRPSPIGRHTLALDDTVRRLAHALQRKGVASAELYTGWTCMGGRFGYDRFANLAARI